MSQSCDSKHIFFLKMASVVGFSVIKFVVWENSVKHA